MMRSFVCAVVVWFCATSAVAREVSGTVRDPSGAVIAGADVTLQAPGLRLQQRTDNRGNFRFADVIGAADVAIQAEGFAPARLRVNADTPMPLKVALRVMPIGQEVVVTPQRSPVALSQTDASVVRFSQEALVNSGGATLDDKLRQAPGFSLLRRTGSVAANPTTQGASLRGLAASGASRILVLDDGVPLNDPFGGWIYWDRVPAEAISSVEVMQGGASHLYGSGALAGVVNITERQPPEEAAADLSLGNEDAPRGSARFAHSFHNWVLSTAAEGFRDSGYVAVRSPDRGAVDAPLTLRYGTGVARVERRVARNGNLFGSVSLFDEGRGNGTPLQVNSTRLVEIRTGIDVDAGPGRLALRGFGSAQRYAQSFSSIATDRSRETLTSWQHVPAQQEGGEAQWTAVLGARHSIATGAEVREMRGVSDEMSFTRTPPTTTSAGGTQTLAGVYGSDSIRVRNLTITAGGRLDRWSNRPLAGVARDGTAASPHFGAVVDLRGGFTWTASAYRSFRAPTLNELYRNFRVGNVLTLANGALSPERLTGAETGIGFGRENLRVRANAFWDEVRNPVANTTLSTAPQLIIRQRENLGSLRSRGMELSVESRLMTRWTIRGAYQFVDATVLSFPANPSLVGLFIPQVPRHAFSAAVAYSQRAWTLSAQARASGRQFDDDQNRLPLDPMFDVDLFVSRQVARSIDLYVAAENVLDQRYMVGRTATATWGPPILIRGGVRLRLAR